MSAGKHAGAGVRATLAAVAVAATVAGWAILASSEPPPDERAVAGAELAPTPPAPDFSMLVEVDTSLPRTPPPLPIRRPDVVTRASRR